MNTSFFGIKHHSSLKAYKTSSNHLELLKRRSLLQKTKNWCTVYAKHRHPIRQDFSFCCQNVNLLRLHHVSITGSRLKCTKKSRFSSLFFTPLWKERIFLIRVCVYSVVISGLFLLVWFGSYKVKGYVETKLLPSVCLVISERIQREFRVGKVRRISPLSLTLESCSFGPHKEEFSCGEVPIVKLRLHPFASLMRGKVVVDAVLSHPSVLIVQKKDYSWLGIPESEGGIKRNLSAEGIDCRTRTRRLAQEEAAARLERERDDAAREAAKNGYFVSESSQGDDLKETQVHSRGETGSNSFFCMSEGKHDHHCVDKGVDYDMKHGELEKTFRVKFPGSSGLRYWSRVIKRYGKHKFKRKSKRSDISASGVAIKKRIFECSASAAHAYFCGRSRGNTEEPSSSSECFHSMNLDKHLIKNDVDKVTESVASGDDDKGIVAQNGVDVLQPEGLSETLPVMLDSVHFRGATVMLLAYGDNEVREMENVNGHVKFRNHYNHINIHLNGNCKPWRSDVICKDGGWLSADVFIDITKQEWHTNLKIDNLYVPLFERILEIPITWSKGRASGELHLCVSKGETFPNIHGQLDVTGLNFQLLDASACFSNISASLCFRVQRIFLHNACGWFGSIPLEASGDFGIHPEEGELHIKCEVPGVDVNALMKTFNMKSFSFPLAGSVTALFNCQGPLDNPIFVGTGMVSRTSPSLLDDTPATVASEAFAKSKEAGAVAAFDRVPFSYVSANFTFNTDNCVADLYGIRASLVDGGEIQGAGTAWICPEGEEDETALDVNFSGNLAIEKIFLRYIPNYHSLMPLKLGVIHGETKILGSLSRPKLDIKWTAPSAEGSFSDARGNIVISHDFVSVNSASAAFDLYMKAQTTNSDDFSHTSEELCAPKVIPFICDKIELDLNMHEFEFFRLVTTYTLDFPRPLLLKATGRVKFQGKLLEPSYTVMEQNFDENGQHLHMLEKGSPDCLVGEVSISGLKLNQLVLAPQLSGSLRVSPKYIKLDASGRPDESFEVEFIRPLQSSDEDDLKSGQLLFISLQKGKLGASVNIQQSLSASLEVQNFPLDELELASLRGVIQRAEIQANLQKRRGHGILSVLGPKFIGVLGKSLDVAARWSGDVITIEKVIFEQSNSHYELQGEYVLPGARDRNPVDGKGDGFSKGLMSRHLGSVISSMGRWRMKLEVCRAEIAEILPLARLLSRSMDPTVLSRSKDFFIRSLQSMGLYSTSSQQLLELIMGHHASSHDVVLEDINLPDLFDLKGRWHGSVGASGGGDGDTLAKFDIHGEDWELGEYKTQRILAVGAYSNDNGMRLKNFLIQNDNATIHADGNLLGPKTNLHFAVLNFPVSLVPTVAQLVESTTTDSVHYLEPLLAPIKGVLHMEGDLRGSLTKPECDVQIRLLDGSVGGIDLERAEVVASLTSTSRFLFNAKFEPIIQNGHVLIQGNIPVTFVQNNTLQQDEELDQSGATLFPGWVREKTRGTAADASKKNTFRDRNEEVWNTWLAKSLEGLYSQNLDVGEVRVDADIKDGGMMLITALTPYADWLHGNADVMLEVRGTVDQPLLNGYAIFHRASISSPVFRKPLTNFGGTVQMKSNRLSITSLESRLSGKGKLLVRGNLPLRTSEETLDDKIELKCDVLEVHAENILSGQVDSELRITGSILQPIVSGNVKLSRGEVYLPRDGSSGDSQALASNQSALSAGGGDSQEFASRYISQYFGLRSASLTTKSSQSSTSVNGSSDVDKDVEKMLIKPSTETRLSDLKLVFGPELKIVYPLILIFTVSGELELNGLSHPKCIAPRGILVFENGEVELLATQVRLKREHLNIAKFEPEYGLDPLLDLALVGSQFQYRIQGRASNWQGSVEQDTLSPIEAVRKFESQLAESILKGNGQLALEKLATATLEKLMPRIEGKGEFGNARWRIMYSPQIPSLVSSGATVDTFEFLAGNLTFGTDFEVQLGKRLQARVTRQIKDSEMATHWSLSYQLTSRLHLRLQSSPLLCIFFEYYATT